MGNRMDRTWKLDGRREEKGGIKCGTLLSGCVIAWILVSFNRRNRRN